VAVQSRPSSEAAWVALGVDDLTKYRIVEHLYQSPGRPDGVVGVAALAASLGFHSVEQTLAALRELAEAGTVWLESEPDALPRCGPTPDPAIHAEITHLLTLDRDPAAMADLLACLAGRSLARVEARVRSRSARRGRSDGGWMLAAGGARP